MSIDPKEYRRTIGLFATGVAVITARVDDVTHGMTVNPVTSVSLDPLLLLVCIGRRARMCRLIAGVQHFAINILSAHQEDVSRHFAGQSQDYVPLAFKDVNGVPVLAETLAVLVCTIDRVLDGGDHIIVLGRVDHVARAAYDESPLLYYAGRYCQLEANTVPILG
jgi:flavin reductase (DIM6/NTAB) family NADH-FMN oxidoreductase RutF